MDKFIYIHGFNSGGNSRSGRSLSQILGVPVFCPEYDYSRPFAECLASIRRQILEAIDEENDRVTVMGSSLGGFYALQFRHPSVVHVVAWNPVVFPAVQLEQFLGANKRFSDGASWEFTREVLLSYAQAPDSRLWRNEAWLREQRRFKEKETSRVFLGIGGDRVSLTKERAEVSSGSGHLDRGFQSIPKRDIFLADHDEVLDARLTRAYWQRWANLYDIVSGHQILDYSHASALLRQGKLLRSFASWTAGDEWAAPFGEAGRFCMAAMLESGEARISGMLRLADVPYLAMKGRKGESTCDITAVFFHARHEERMSRLLSGLVKFCGLHSYVLLRSDGTALRHQCAAHYLQDAEYNIVLPEAASFSSAVQTAFPGWRGEGAMWHGRERAASFNQAMMRSHFASLWDSCEDPVAALESKD